MEALIPIAVSLVNALATLVPQIPGFVARISASADLSADGRALLDSMEGAIDRHVKHLDEKSKPLPVPDEKPTP